MAQVKQGLEEEGLTGLGDAVTSNRSDFRRVTVQRREGFRNKDIFLPLVLHGENGEWRELDYQRHILPGIDWSAIDAPDPQGSLPDRATRQSATVDVGDALPVFHPDRELYVDKTVPISRFTRRLSDVVPIRGNPPASRGNWWKSCAPPAIPTLQSTTVAPIWNLRCANM